MAYVMAQIAEWNYLEGHKNIKNLQNKTQHTFNFKAGYPLLERIGF